MEPNTTLEGTTNTQTNIENSFTDYGMKPATKGHMPKNISFSKKEHKVGGNWGTTTSYRHSILVPRMTRKTTINVHLKNTTNKSLIGDGGLMGTST